MGKVFTLATWKRLISIMSATEDIRTPLKRIVHITAATRWTPFDEWMLDSILCTFESQCLVPLFSLESPI